MHRIGRLSMKQVNECRCWPLARCFASGHNKVRLRPGAELTVIMAFPDPEVPDAAAQGSVLNVIEVTLPACQVDDGRGEIGVVINLEFIAVALGNNDFSLVPRI